MKNKIINKNLNTDNIITCDNISVSCGSKKNNKLLLNNLSYAFEKGKVYAIVGNSGVGKTTLAMHLNALRIPSSGNIFIKDKVITANQRKIKDYKDIRKIVGLVFQFPEHQLFKDTVEKDILYGPINYHVNKEEAKEIASKYMYLVGLDKSLLYANPFDLSNGQKRLVTIASILSIEPEVVILDEPTAGLDAQGQKHIVHIINELKNKNKTVIIVTHNMDNVLELADEVLVLHNQQLYKTGTPYQIFSDKKLLNEVGLETPFIINVLNKLHIRNKQPRTIADLAKVLKKGGY